MDDWCGMIDALISFQMRYRKSKSSVVDFGEIGWAQMESILRRKKSGEGSFKYGDQINNASTKINSLNDSNASAEYLNINLIHLVTCPHALYSTLSYYFLSPANACVSVPRQYVLLHAAGFLSKNI